MDPAKPGSQQLDFPRAFEVRGFVFETESVLSDPEAQAGVNFAEMPRQLSDGAAFGVGSEVVLVVRECFENADCALPPLRSRRLRNVSISLRWDIETSRRTDDSSR